MVLLKIVADRPVPIFKYKIRIEEYKMQISQCFGVFFTFDKIQQFCNNNSEKIKLLFLSVALDKHTLHSPEYFKQNVYKI